MLSASSDNKGSSGSMPAQKSWDSARLRSLSLWDSYLWTSWRIWWLGDSTPTSPGVLTPSKNNNGALLWLPQPFLSINRCQIQPQSIQHVLPLKVIKSTASTKKQEDYKQKSMPLSININLFLVRRASNKLRRQSTWVQLSVHHCKALESQVQ